MRIQLRADYVAVPVTLTAESKEATKGSEEVERAVRALSERVKQQPGLQLRTGVVSLAPREAGSYSSSSGSYGGSSARLHVLTPLKDD